MFFFPFFLGLWGDGFRFEWIACEVCCIERIKHWTEQTQNGNKRKMHSRRATCWVVRVWFNIYVQKQCVPRIHPKSVVEHLEHFPANSPGDSDSRWFLETLKRNVRLKHCRRNAVCSLTAMFNDSSSSVSGVCVYFVASPVWLGGGLYPPLDTDPTYGELINCYSH